MFGTSANLVSNTTSNVISNNVHVQLSGKESGIMASLVSVLKGLSKYSYKITLRKFYSMFMSDRVGSCGHEQLEATVSLACRQRTSVVCALARSYCI